MTAATTTTPTAGKGYRYLVVGLLAVVYTFNFMDRQILATLTEPIRKDLGFSDTQMGLLGGLSFALFYTTFGIPVAWLCDRSRRVTIMAAACAIWSLATAGCGMAKTFLQLAVLRMTVGVGEAGGSPPSYSLISDYFPAKERGTGLALYSLGVPLGSMMGAALGAGVAAEHGWRVAFFVVGLPGVVLALLMLLVIREPKRGGLDPLAAGDETHAAAPPALQSIGEFFTNPTLVCVAISCALTAFVGYALLNWNAPMLMRVKGMTLKEVSAYYSVVLGATGVIGTFGSGWMADKLSRRDPRWYAWISALAFCVTLFALAGIIMSPTWQMTLVFVGLGALAANMYLAPALAVVQNAVAPGQRTMAGAILLFVLNLVGLGGGPTYVGFISDKMKAAHGAHSLLYGYGALYPIIVLAIISHLVAAKFIARDRRLAAVA